MAKQLKQLRNFLEGTNSAPSASDIPDESPTYSLNLETLDEEGKLKGGRKNVPLIANDSYLQYYINLGANETSGEIKYCYTLFGEDSTKVSKTIDNNTPVWLQNKLLRKSFRSLISSNPYTDTVTLLPHTITSNGTVNSTFESSLVQLESGIDASVTQIEFSTAVFSTGIFDVNDIIKIDSEYMRITSVEVPENPGGSYNFRLNVDRGWSVDVDANGDNIPGVAATHSSGALINCQGTFGTIYITYIPQIDSAATANFYKLVGTTQTTLTKIDNSDYLEINARNMILVDHKNDNSNSVTSDLIYYDKNTSVNPPEYKMKVLENFYKENEAPIKLVDIENSSINTSNEGFPESVSLAKGPNAIYVGTGSTASTKPQWFGKPSHSQFGKQVDTYILENAELKAIDDGNSIFNLSFVEAPFVGTAPATRANNIYNVALSGGKRYLYAYYNGTDTTLKGKQFKSLETIGFIPTAIGSSQKLHTMFESELIDNEPIGGDWNGANSNTEFAGHDNTTSYHYVAEAGSRDKIHVFATRMHFSGNPSVPEVFMHHHFGYFILEHHLVIDAQLANITRLDANDKLLRPPKNGSYINDIYVKNGHVYIQYGHESGFTFDEEYLYTFPETDLIDHSAITMGDSTKVVAKPITPPIMKMKNHGKDFKSYGYDWWGPPETCDFTGVANNSDVGGEGIYNMYSNWIRWKNIDILGFTKKTTDDKVYHSLYERTYWDHSESNWVTTEPDTGSWNKAFAKADENWSDEEASEYPGYETENERTNTDPDYRNNMQWDSQKEHPIYYGFETCSVFTQQGGIYNISGNDTTEGLISCVVFIDGKQIANGLKTDVRRYYTNAPFRVRYVLHNENEPEIENVSEQCLLTTTREALGVAQRIIPYFADAGIFRDGDNGGAGTESFQNVNGMAIDNWDSNDFEDDGNNNNSIDWDDDNNYVKAPIKMSWRSGCYGTSMNNATYPTNRPRRMQMHNLIRLGTGYANSTTNNFTLRAPNVSSGALPVARNYNGEADFITSSRTDEMDKVSTYLSRWSTVIPLLTDVQKVWPSGTQSAPDNVDNPLQITDVGASGLQNIYGSGIADAIGLFPTAGRLQTGEVHYNYSNNTYVTNNINADDQYGDKFFKYDSGLLSVGLTPNFVDQTLQITDTEDADGDGDTTDLIYDTGNFMHGNTYTWKMSLLYDGYQEGPLSAAEFTVAVPTGNYNGCNLTIELSEPPKRVSEIVIYRKNGLNEYYRMVAEVSLANGWNYDAQKDTYKKTILDNGRQSATYEAITGIPETLQNTMIHYNLSTVAQGHLIVADCFHPEIKQGQNFIYKSEPNAFSNFNWTKNWCVLPTKPTAITWFAGKIFAFDLNNMYRINLDNLVLEDTFEGVGCIGPDSIVVTDMGMFFCDYQGLYWHNGQKAENIGTPILKSSYGEDITNVIETNPIKDKKFSNHAWQDISHKIPPKIIYDPKTISAFFCFQNAKSYNNIEYTFNGAWKFNLTRKRLDLVQLPEIKGVLTGQRNDSYISGNQKLYRLTKSDIERENYNFYSKKFDMGTGSEEKAFYSVKLGFNNKAAATRWIASSSGVDLFTNEDNTTININQKIEQDNNVVVYKIPGSDRKAKWLKIHIHSASEEIDSISIVYRQKKVK